MFWKVEVWPFDPTPRVCERIYWQNICYHVAACVIPLIWYAKWPYSERVEFWPLSYPLSSPMWLDPGFPTKILFDMLHIYCECKCCIPAKVIYWKSHFSQKIGIKRAITLSKFLNDLNFQTWRVLNDALPFCNLPLILMGPFKSYQSETKCATTWTLTETWSLCVDYALQARQKWDKISKGNPHTFIHINPLSEILHLPVIVSRTVVCTIPKPIDQVYN